MDNDELDKYAKEIVRITYQLERVCKSKEVIFCKDLEITPSEFRFLRHIKESKEVNAKDIADIMDSTAPRISKLLKDLQEKNYITIKKYKNDKRYSLISLSKKGDIFINEIMNEYIEFHKDLLSPICDKEDLPKMIKTLITFENTLTNFCSIN